MSKVSKQNAETCDISLAFLPLTSATLRASTLRNSPLSDPHCTNLSTGWHTNKWNTRGLRKSSSQTVALTDPENGGHVEPLDTEFNTTSFTNRFPNCPIAQFMQTMCVSLFCTNFTYTNFLNTNTTRTYHYIIIYCQQMKYVPCQMGVRII